MATKIYLVEADGPRGDVPKVHAAAGYKQCTRLELHHAWKTPEGLVCPGCARTCLLPGEFVHGQAFLTMKRPE